MHEINFIGKWIDQAVQGGYKPFGIYSKCLADIKLNYPEMIPYFHKNHVLDMGKFQYGHERYKELNRQSLNI
jgi:hypothetical protein